MSCHFCLLFILTFVSFASVNPKQISKVNVYINVRDVNEHAPEFSDYYETYVCENAGSGQVRWKSLVDLFSSLLRSASAHPFLAAWNRVRFSYLDRYSGMNDFFQWQLILVVHIIGVLLLSSPPQEVNGEWSLALTSVLLHLLICIAFCFTFVICFFGWPWGGKSVIWSWVFHQCLASL